MKRHIRIALLVMIAVTAVSVTYFYDVARMVRATPDEPRGPAFAEPEAPLYEPTDPPITVKLFFPAASNDVLLRTRDTTIFASTEVPNRARQIIERLISGADDDTLFGRLPAESRLNEVFVSSSGIAYVDFNNALSDNHPGGVLPEQATIYSIVNSLAYNLPEIERVKILIGGVEKETLAGHCLLLLPFEPDLSIADIGAAAEVSAMGTHSLP